MSNEYAGLYILMTGPVVVALIILAIDLLDDRRIRRQRSGHRAGNAGT